MIESDEIKRRLNQIDKVRARGVGDHISLPQLVVCGDQSAGKSSVLEGVTGIPFPRKDGLCTKFATEIILRHTQEEQKITASIIPHKSRDDTTASDLRAYSRGLSGYDELPDVIQEVAKLMRLRGFTDDEEAPAFAADVLRIEVTGQTGLYLTIVDLPGLISVSEEEDDIKLVRELVDSYLESSRTIILAVVQATSDIETQPIIQHARRFDKAGERTVGIITKPDLINRNTEGRVALLANNLGSTKLKLGFFLLKNPTPEQLERGITHSEREEEERKLFDDPKWTIHGLDPNRVGVHALRKFLESLLERHIERELPKVRSDISQLLLTAQKQLEELGDERSTVAEQRLFLSKLSMAFWGLFKSAIDGTYQDASSDFFSQQGNGTLHNRVRAHIHYLNSIFANFMRDHSHKRQIREHDNNEGSSKSGVEEVSDISADLEQCHLSAFSTAILVTKKDFDNWVMKMYRNTRGRELPGNYNHRFLMELFHEQSSRWPDIAREHTMVVHQKVSGFVDRALAHLVKEDHVRIELHHIMESSLQANLDTALDELKKICADEKMQPITYNHYFTDNVQKSRQDGMRDAVKNAFQLTLDSRQGQLHVNNTPFARESLLASLQMHISVDMDRQACQEASTALTSYYKVAMKTFVDNVCRQVIERHIISKLPNIFHPTAVVQFSDEDVERIAMEQKSTIERRRELKTLVKILNEGLNDLRG